MSDEYVFADIETVDPRISSMGEESIPRLLWRFSLPATIALVVMASYNIVDTMFVGRIGSDAIAALSVCFPIQMIILAFGTGTGVGAASLIARSLGAGNKSKTSDIAGQVFLLSVILGIVITVPGIIFMRPILMAFGATPDIIDLTAEYMTTIMLGTFFWTLAIILTNITRSEGNAVLSMRNLIISSLLNVILDPIFIFTLKMGVRGAAIATIISKVVLAWLLLHYYISGRSVISIKRVNLKPSLPIILDIYRVGVPSMIIQMSGNFALVIVNRFLGSFDYLPIAVMGLFIRFQNFILMPSVGIAQGMLPIIGFNYGAKMPQRIREAFLKGSGAGMFFTLVTAAALFIAPQFFLRIFTSDRDLLILGSEAMRIMILTSTFLAPIQVAISFFQGVGKGTPTLVLSLLRQFLIYIPCVYVLFRLFSLKGIWYSTPVADSLAFLVTVVMLITEMRRQNIPLFQK